MHEKLDVAVRTRDRRGGPATHDAPGIDQSGIDLGAHSGVDFCVGDDAFAPTDFGAPRFELRLDEQDQEALKERAAAEGISMQDAARRAIRDYVAKTEHRSRVSTATELILDVHAEAIERLGR